MFSSAYTHLIRLRGVAIVSLHVGKEKPPFQVHKSILSDASPFFDAAFNGSFSESVTHSMDLPDEDPEAFEALLQWIYFRTYEIPPFDSARRDARASYMKLARLYVSADKFQMTALKNEVIDRWYGISHEAWLADKEAVDYVYENTSATSTLRRLVVADYVWRRRANWYGSEKADLQFRERSDLATDVLIAMVQKNEEEEENPFTLGSAHFHDTPAEPKRKP